MSSSFFSNDTDIDFGIGVLKTGIEKIKKLEMYEEFKLVARLNRVILDLEEIKKRNKVINQYQEVIKNE